MPNLSRIAVGSLPGQASHRIMLWALMSALERSGTHLQMFLSQACFSSLDAASPITGQSHRHLDSWLMPADVCREIFWHGCGGADLAIVEGQYDSPETTSPETGGSLDTICRWLRLPRLLVLDASRLADCKMPSRPAEIDGLLLDRVSSIEHALRLQTHFESLWGVPVLGSLRALPRIRSIIENLPLGSMPSRELCLALGNELSTHFHSSRLLQLSASRQLPSVESRLFRNSRHSPRLNIAVAYDEAFHRYFPDTLDLLEIQGATVHDFSPLRDEALPCDTDLVYLGCGQPELMAEQLAGNHCMLLALRKYIQAGGRVYAEGGGMAYLCHHMILQDGTPCPMVGALPAIAFQSACPDSLKPAALTLAKDNWLGEASSRMCGYLSNHWQLQKVGALESYATEGEHRYDLVGRGQVIGSRLHVNFASQLRFLQHFFRPLLPLPETSISS